MLNYSGCRNAVAYPATPQSTTLRNNLLGSTYDFKRGMVAIALGATLRRGRDRSSKRQLGFLKREARRKRRASLMPPTAIYFVVSNCGIAFS
jgi:hypothetical protein